MKKILFLAMICLLAACSTKSEKKVAEEMKFSSGIFTTVDTEVVDIEFQNGESPYFGIYMNRGSEKENVVWIEFYNANDINEGQVKAGSTPCRYYQVVIPHSEVAKKWGYNGLITTRKDGSEHHIKWRLVNQPA